MQNQKQLPTCFNCQRSFQNLITIQHNFNKKELCPKCFREYEFYKNMNFSSDVTDKSWLQYEKIIYFILYTLSNKGIYDFNDENIATISDFFQYDFNKVKEILSSKIKKTFLGIYTITPDPSLLSDNIFRYILIIQAFENFDNTEDINEKINNLFDANHHLEMMICHLSEFDYFSNQENEKYTELFDDPNLNVTSIIKHTRNLLRLIENDNKSATQTTNNNQFFSNITKFISINLSILPDLAKFLIEVQANNVFFMSLLKLLSSGLVVDEIETNIASDILNFLFPLLKNSGITSWHFDDSHITNTNVESRGKIDNTTRLVINYVFSNFDTYSLRLDLPHKGQPFIHWNNISLGNIEANILSNEDYIDIKQKVPNIESFFIHYQNGQYALKEESNISFMNKAEHDTYQKIIDMCKHKSFSKTNYSEQKFCLLIKLIGMLTGKKIHTNQSTITEKTKKSLCKNHLFYLCTLCFDQNNNINLNSIKEYAIKYFGIEANILTGAPEDQLWYILQTIQEQ